MSGKSFDRRCDNASAGNMGDFAASEQDALEELQHNYLSLRIDHTLADARESGDNASLMHGDDPMPVMICQRDELSQ